METIAIVNGIDGAGKTVTSLALASYLSERGKVLLVDADYKQKSATLIMQKEHNKLEKTVFPVLTYNGREIIADECSVAEVVTGTKRFDLLTADEICSTNKIFKYLNMAAEDSGYDYVVFDMPAGVDDNDTFRELITASIDVVLYTPKISAIEAEAFAGGKMHALFSLVNGLGKNKPKIHGMLPLQYNAKQNGDRAILEAFKETAEKYGLTFLGAIASSTAVAESVLQGMSVLDYAPGDASSRAYREVFDSILPMLDGRQ